MLIRFFFIQSSIKERSTPCWRIRSSFKKEDHGEETEAEAEAAAAQQQQTGK